MSQVNKSFTALGNGGFFIIQPGQSFTYDVSGSFSGTVILEQTRDGGLTFKPAEVILTAPGSGTLEYPRNNSSKTWYRFRCTVFGSGTIVTVIADASDNVVGSQVVDGEGNVVYEGVDDGLKMGDGKDLVISVLNGSSIGQTASQKTGFHGARVIKGAALTANTSAMSFTATGATSAAMGAVTSGDGNCIGFATIPQAEALILTVKNLQEKMDDIEARGVAKGIHA